MPKYGTYEYNIYEISVLVFTTQLTGKEYNAK